MTKTILTVGGMSCEHCVKAITKALTAIPGVVNVGVDLATRVVTVEHERLESITAKIKAEITEQGYEVIS